MDGRRFDALAKKLVAGSSRRGFIGRISRLGGAILGVAGAGALGAGARLGTAQEEFPIDHFKCYDVAPGDRFSPLDVELKDQFGSGRVRVGPPDTLCTPVGKNGADIRDPATHLTCYPIEELEPTDLPPAVVVDNQFGNLTLKIGKTRRLCVPSHKSLPPDDGGCEPRGDHFTCYTAKPAEGEVKVLSFEVKNQFEAGAVRIQDPRVVCAPTDKNGGGIPDPDLHYECRQIVAASPEFQPRKVIVENQIGRFTFAVEKPEFLCAPSCKALEGQCDAIPKANHYECYAGTTTEGEVQLSEVTLKDQLDSGTAKVDVPRLLCAPVDKNGEGIMDDALHYAVHPLLPGTEFQPRKAFVANQFGQTVFELEAPEFLFVPSCKTIPE